MILKKSPFSQVLMMMIVAVFFLSIFTGCDRSKSKIEGTYVSQDGQKFLELNSDGTYVYRETRSPFLGGDDITEGEWEISKYGQEEIVNFYPTLLLLLRKTKDGYKFSSATTDENFEKQDTSSKFID